MNSRTAVDFPRPAKLWAIIDDWAAETGYRPKPSPADDRLYQKGIGFLVAPMMLRVIDHGEQVTLEAWVRVNLFVRATSLFLLPAEMSIESGGFRGMAPRKIARTAVNKLLDRLLIPQIP